MKRSFLRMFTTGSLFCLFLGTSITSSGQSAKLLKSETFNDDNEVIDSVRYTYGTNDKLIERTRYAYFATNNLWKPTWKYEYTYDFIGNLESQVYYSHVFQQGFEKVEKKEFTFDGTGNHLTTEVYRRENGAWVSDKRISYTHNASYQIEREVTEYYVTADSLFEREITEYTYDGQRLAVALTRRWDVKTEKMDKAIEMRYFYDSQDVLVKEEESNWIAGQWYKSHYFKYIYTSFDEIKRRERWIFNSGQQWDHVNYYYDQEDQSTGMVGSSEATLVYPNPGRGKVHFISEVDQKEVKILNLLGNPVLHFKASGTHSTLDLSPLNQGVYIYRVIAENGAIQTGRIQVR